MNIRGKQNNILDVFVSLLSSAQEKFNVYTKNGVPEKLHYRNNGRVQDIVLVAREGYVFR